jgi:hypothetical protein
MSTSTAALIFAPRKPKKSPRKTSSSSLLGGVAIACLVAGCGWTVYTNIIAASVYPTLHSADYDEPVVKRPARAVARSASEAVNEVFASIQAPASAMPKREAAAPITQSMFNERFAAAQPQGVASNAASATPPQPVKLAEAPKPEVPKPDAVKPDVAKVAAAPKPADAPKLAEAPKAKPAQPAQPAAPPAQLALNEPPPRPEPKKSGMIHDMAERAKAAVMSIASNDKASMVEKLWGKQPSHGAALLAYASADASVTASIGREQSPMLGGSPPYDTSTAVYDISRHTVYLPDGSRLEAHSGLGSNLDDPHSARVRMRGVTPPHIYDLKPREALFHGVPALRLTPIGGEDAIYGRDGLLAHTYMLGPNGDSNGCVSFRDYYAFLEAYRNKGIRKLAVLARID